MADDTILVAKETFSTEINGYPETVTAGVTRVRASHPLALQNPDYFEPVADKVDFDVEQTTKKAGEKRGKQ